MAWTKSTRITIMLAIDVLFFLLEITVGLVVGSLALMADAFHMLNDIISLLVGLWAVRAAQKSSSDKFSYGWLRAEILGAFFNAVFLIALCLSIVLEAITRLIDPPEISNAMLILIVGSCGLASNLIGFFVLGGHGHSHGEGEDHDHDHDHAHDHVDKVKAAEEGHGDFMSQSHTDDVAADENGFAGDMLPEAAIARATTASPGPKRHIKFSSSDETASTARESSEARPSSRASKHRRRTSSVRNSRLLTNGEISIHPASFRQDIINASRSPLDGIESEDGSLDGDDGVGDDADVDENSPLLTRSRSGNKNTGDHNHDHDHDHDHNQGQQHDGHSHGDNNGSRPAHSHEHEHSHGVRRDSVHVNHNHNKPKKEAKSHGHNHADMGMRAMILHVIGDALGNVGVIASALIIMLTTSPYRFYADPAVSLFITLIILRSTIPLTKATAKILLQATPEHIDLKDVKEDIQTIPGVVSCHHVHIWQLSDSQIIASMHIQISFPITDEDGSTRYMELAKAARKCLHAYGIHSATIQPEFCLDKAHSHGQDGGAGNSHEQDSDSCLLECVDDCTGKGCCKPAPEAQHAHSEHDGHVH